MFDLRIVAKNFFSLSGANIASKFLEYLAIVYLARSLGSETFGEIAFAQALFVYFTFLADFGLQTLGTRDIARGRWNLKEYAGQMLSLRLFLAILSFVLVLLLALFIPKPPEIKGLIILYGLSLFPLAVLLEWFFQGLEAMHYIGIGRIVRSIIFIALVFSFIKKREHLLAIPVYYFVATCVSAGFLYLIFSKKYGRARLNRNVRMWQEFLKESLPMGLAFIMATIYIQISTVLLGFLKSSSVVGNYNAAYKIVLFLNAFGPLFGAAILPTISRYYVESPQKLRSFLYQYSKLTTLIGFLIALGGTILGKQIITIIYGPEYKESILAFRILIWSVVAVYANIPWSFSLLGCGQQKGYLCSSAIAMVIGIGMNFYLILKHSLNGAAFATMFTEFTVLIMFYIYSQRTVLKYQEA